MGDNPADEMFFRRLLQDGEDGVQSSSEVIDSPENSQPLRIAAVFIVLAAGLLGGMPALFIPVMRQLRSTPALLLRALSAGIIVSLALVHIIPEAIASLDQVEPDYPVGSCCVLAGVLVLLVLETASHTFFETHSSLGPSLHTQGHLTLEPPPTEGQHDTVKRPSMSDSTPKSGRNVTPRLKVIATVMELGCIFHSVLIGVTVGVTTEYKEVTSLLIALCFHQLLEGVALGSMVAAAGFHVWKGLLMVLGYALTAPMGIGIGIGVAHMYNEDDTATAAVQGVLNGVSGGMLLYISLVQIIANDFNSSHCSTSGYVKLAMIVLVGAGAAFMCVLALWL